MDDASRTSPPPPGPSASTAGTSRFPAETNGDGGNPATEAAKQAAHHLNELKAYAGYFVSAKVDGIKATAKNIAVYAVLGIVGGIIGMGILLTAAFLLLSGLANALGALMGGRVWAGQLIVGFVVLAAVGVGTWIFLKKFTEASRKQTELKYASKRNQQRVDVGKDVHERATGR